MSRPEPSVCVVCVCACVCCVVAKGKSVQGWFNFQTAEYEEHLITIVWVVLLPPPTTRNTIVRPLLQVCEVCSTIEKDVCDSQVTRVFELKRSGTHPSPSGGECGVIDIPQEHLHIVITRGRHPKTTGKWSEPTQESKHPRRLHVPST